MEAWAKEVVAETFAADVAAGRLVFSIVNKDLDANAHYVDDFEMTSNGLVLARRSPDGTWAYEKLEKIWDLSDDREAFGAHVRDATRAFLAGPGAR
jgi:ABC-type hemin transport system ATPase subunit